MVDDRINEDGRHERYDQRSEARALGRLEAALDAVGKAVEAGNSALRDHVREQKAEAALLANKQDDWSRSIEARISSLEAARKKDETESAQVGRWVKAIYAAFGLVGGAAILRVIDWADSAISAARVIRPSVLALAALVTAWAVLFALPALSATYYVAPGGSNTASGSIDAPWANINHAATRVTLGDIVVVRCGTYAESVRTTQHGAAGRPILYQAEQRGCARLVPPPNNNSATAWAVESNYTTVDGVEIDGTTHQSGTRWAIGIRMAGIYNTVTGAVVHDIGRAGACSETGYGIGSDGLAGAEYAEINGNTVYNIGPAGGC